MCVVKRLEQDRYHTLCPQVQGSGQSNLYTGKNIQQSVRRLPDGKAVHCQSWSSGVQSCRAPHSCLKTLISWFRVN